MQIHIEPEVLWFHISRIWPDAECIWQHPQLGLIAYRGPQLEKTIVLKDVEVSWPTGVTKYPNAKEVKNS